MTSPPKKTPRRKPLRDNVVGFIMNRRGRVLVMKRAKMKSHWQLPQGGVDTGETKRRAVLREVGEEVGLKKLTILGVAGHFHSYEWPKGFKHAIEPYRGQRQTVFFLRHEGKDSDVVIDEREASDHQWVHMRDLVQTIAPVRRPMVKKAMAIYRDLFTMKK
jgi:putative (di)nucleoside polyphosphate hydrolase